MEGQTFQIPTLLRWVSPPPYTPSSVASSLSTSFTAVFESDAAAAARAHAAAAEPRREGLEEAAEAKAPYALNGGERVDWVLQETELEATNEYLSALYAVYTPQLTIDKPSSLPLLHLAYASMAHTPHAVLPRMSRSCLHHPIRPLPTSSTRATLNPTTWCDSSTRRRCASDQPHLHAGAP